MKKVALMSCRSPFLDDSKVYVPLANLYLKSYIEQHHKNIEITLLDDDYDIAKPEMFEPYDYIGVSIMTPQREEAHKLLTTIKQKYPEKKMIAGGPHVKHYLSNIVKEPWDYLVPLDGERALRMILTGEKSRVVEDVMSRSDIKNQPRPDRTSDNARKIIQNYHYVLQGKKASTMMTARGCPEKCTFCEDAETTVKWSSLENLKGEMDDIKNMGFEGVYIFDDLFAIAMNMVRPICDELSKRDLVYRCNGQVRYFTKWGEDFAKMLGSTGCVEIAFGFESGSQKILDNIQKRTSVEMNYKAVEYAQKNGIKVKGFVMLGLPGENLETIAATESFIANSGIDDFQLAIYYPYKGTKIRDAIDRNDNSADIMFVGEGLGAYGQKGGSTESVVRTSTLTAEELLYHRDRLVNTYKPKSHEHKWKDKFRETHLKTRPEYDDKLEVMKKVLEAS